jgi:hypothetical protein
MALDRETHRIYVPAMSASGLEILVGAPLTDCPSWKKNCAAKPAAPRNTCAHAGAVDRYFGAPTRISKPLALIAGT